MTDIHLTIVQGEEQATYLFAPNVLDLLLGLSPEDPWPQISALRPNRQLLDEARTILHRAPPTTRDKLLASRGAILALPNHARAATISLYDDFSHYRRQWVDGDGYW